MPALRLTTVSKSHPSRRGPVVALHPTSLNVESGETLVLLGPTGSGKSTLLRLVAGLDAPDAGSVEVAGVRVDRLPPHRRGVAMLSQKPALYPHLTVEQNLKAGGGDVSRAFDVLRLAPLLSRYPHQLSGGELQRAALAKLVARPAAVWLLDEPFAGLDPVFRADFRADLHLLAGQARATMLIVTHDPADAWAFGRCVGVLEAGSLLQLGTPEELRADPGHRFVAVCLGQIGLVDGVVKQGVPAGQAEFASACGAVVVAIPPGLAIPPGHDLTLGIRPEDVVAVLPGGSIPDIVGTRLAGWSVISAEPAGSGRLLTLAAPGGSRVRLRAEWRSGSPPPVGAVMDGIMPAGKCLWFDARSGRRIDGPP